MKLSINIEMKKTIKYILLLVIIPLLIQAQPCESDVNIITNKETSRIYIDGSLIGEGKLSFKLSKGDYAILIKESKYGWGNQIINDIIHIDGCDKNYTFDYTFIPKLYFNTNPEDVYVYDNDSLIGHTPLFLEHGTNNLLLSKPDYYDKPITLNDIKIGSPIELGHTGKIENGSFVKSPWFKILLGSAVALGATAAYFKIKADKKFDKYLETQDKNYLDETDKYDLYSGLAFGTLQINFGILIYYFITE